MVVAVAPLILLAIAILFLMYIWLGYVLHFGDYEFDLRLYSLPVGLAIVALAFSLACLGFLLIYPTKDRGRQGSRSTAVGFGLVLSALAGIAIIFLVLVLSGYHDLLQNGIWSHSVLVSSTVGLLVFSLAYLGFLLTYPAQNRAWQGFRAVESSIVLFLFAVIGSRFLYRYFDGPQWHALLLLSPLVFFLPAVVAISLGSRTRHETTSSSAKGRSSLMGLVYLSTYVVSLSLYVFMIYFVGLSLLGHDTEFDNFLYFNIIFWFLLPVHSVALLVYTMACGKGGASWATVAARLVLSGVFVPLSYYAFKLVDRIYG